MPWNNGCFSPPLFLIFSFYSFLKFQFPSKNLLLSKCKDEGPGLLLQPVICSRKNVTHLCLQILCPDLSSWGCPVPNCFIKERMMFSLSYDAFSLIKPYLLGKTSSLIPYSQQHTSRSLCFFQVLKEADTKMGL